MVQIICFLKTTVNTVLGNTRVFLAILVFPPVPMSFLVWTVEAVCCSNLTWICQSCNLWFAVLKRWSERWRRRRRGKKLHRSTRSCAMSAQWSITINLIWKRALFYMWGVFSPSCNAPVWLTSSKTVDLKESGRERVKIHIYSRHLYEFRNLGQDVWLPLFLIKGILRRQMNASLHVYCLCSSISLKVSSRTFFLW